MYIITNSEKKELNNTWKFLHYFSNPPGKITKNWFTQNGIIFGPHNYRMYIIHTIQNKYTYQDFYKYEKIINKLFWNLKQKLKNYIKNNKTKYKIRKDINKYIKNKYKRNRSFINSYIQYNENNNKLYVLEKLSLLDKVCMNIMRNKKDYTKYYNDPEKVINYKNMLELYYNMSYPFPNVNPMFYNENKKSIWVKKIKKMYYLEKTDKYDKYWYQFIKI